MFVNLIGGQDELVFDGNSFVMDAQGMVTMRAPAFTEGMVDVELAVDAVRRGQAACPAPSSPLQGQEESVYGALVQGTRDYVDKHRFPGVVLGLSGGIDSALTLCIAVDALGADRVHSVAMPSRYTSQMSRDDAAAQARVAARSNTARFPSKACSRRPLRRCGTNSPGGPRIPPRRTFNRAAAACC